MSGRGELRWPAGGQRLPLQHIIDKGPVMVRSVSLTAELRFAISLLFHNNSYKMLQVVNIRDRIESINGFPNPEKCGTNPFDDILQQARGNFMKKRIRIKWVVLGVVVVLFLWLVYALVTTLPFYPVFRKYVGTYEKLQRALEDYPDMYTANQLELPFTTNEEYYLILDGRTIYAHPNGYAVGGSLLSHGVEVNYGMQCDKGEIDFSAADTSYRGVPLLYELDEIFNKISFQFTLDNYYYYFGAYYDKGTLAQEDVASLNYTIKIQLLELTQQVIDSYLDKE